MKTHGFITIKEVKEDIGQLHNTLIALDKFRQRKEAELKNIESEIQALMDTKIGLEKSIQIAEATLQSRKDEFEAKEKVAQLKIDNRVSEIFQNEKALSVEQKVTEQQKSQLEEQKANLTRKNEAVDLEKKELYQMKIRLDELSKVLTSKGESLDERETKLALKDSEINKKISNCQNKEAEVKSLQGGLQRDVLTLSENKAKLSEEKVAFETKNKIIELDLAGLWEKEKTLKQKEIAILNKEDEIKVREKQLKDKEVSLEAQDRELRIREGLTFEKERLDILKSKGVNL